MITRPLDLRAQLALPPRDFDVVFWVNVGVICLFFALLGSRFVLAPGLAVGVNQAAELELPRVASAEQGTTSVVVSFRRDNMILFEGGIYEFASFRSVLQRYAEARPGASMLVRVDKQVSMQGFLELCDLAREAGFSNVLVAAEQAENSAPQFVPARR